MLSEQLELVLFGTAAGPMATARLQTSSALVVDGDIYIIDAGMGLTTQFWRAGLDFRRVRAIFLTHLHSDHVSDLFHFLSSNWPWWDVDRQRIAIHGPAAAGASGPEDARHPGLPGTDESVVVPECPTPGIVEFLRNQVAANAYDINQRLRSTRRRNDVPLDFTGALHPPMYDVHELPVPAGASVADYAPPMAPQTIYEDENVRVSATLVDHPPVFPAYGFRFDTAHGAVSFSGDTTVSRNLVRLAQGSDVLVHEVNAVDESVGAFTDTPLAETMARQFLTAHTPSRRYRHRDGSTTPGVGEVASAAGAGALVLHHLYPADGSVEAAEFGLAATADFAGPVIVAEDGMRIDVPGLRRLAALDTTIPSSGASPEPGGRSTPSLPSSSDTLEGTPS
ncbi:MBL fold metallo-hydrolase [Nocardioides sp. L-11A]|uniref:MBL fold metallo-hydrolase n=1 Tax=Nocardioides sp. L-11A TaxID=3043848 RepID=UPI00249A5B47|nr:MBL fold metallo-hydrolase [Nocardioides sp. L-11A]